MIDDIEKLGKEIMDAFRNKQPDAKRIRPLITFKGNTQKDADLFLAEKAGQILKQHDNIFYVSSFYDAEDWEGLESELDHLERMLEAAGWSVTWSEGDTALRLLGPLQDAVF